ncbi:ABC transporter substrate-binding protein [Modestobacter lapidis]|nr:ABC transporter substrate-binding protein [Modestobacter lapidis]
MSGRATVGLALEWFVNVDHAPIVVALERGLFDERGLDVHVVEPVDHEAGMALVAAGKLDLAITEPIHMPGERLEGYPIVAIGKYFETGFGLMLKEGVGLGDLAGTTIAAPLGTYAPAMVQAMAEYRGIALERDAIHYADVSYYLVDALRRNEAVGAFAAFENVEVLEARAAGIEVELLRFLDHDVPSPGHLVFCAHEDAVDDPERRDVLERFLGGVVAGVHAVREDPDGALETFLHVAPHLRGELTQQQWADTVGRFTDDLSLDPELWTRLARFVHERGLVEREVSVKELLRPLRVTEQGG